MDSLGTLSMSEYGQKPCRFASNSPYGSRYPNITSTRRLHIHVKHTCEVLAKIKWGQTEKCLTLSVLLKLRVDPSISPALHSTESKYLPKFPSQGSLLVSP